MKTLLLFDIDGTLLTGGPARAAFQSALESTFGRAGEIDGHDFSGKTDPQIARELLRGAGLADAEIDAGLPRLFEAYLSGLEARIEAHPLRRLPGVGTLLETLQGPAAPGGPYALGVVTGNIAAGARLKLASAGLGAYFQIGGYGSDAEHRDALPGVALSRARGHFSRDFGPADTWILGDTPRDVACAQAHGLRCLGVATGQHAARALAAAGADHVLTDFSDTGRVLSILAGGRP